MCSKSHLCQGDGSQMKPKFVVAYALIVACSTLTAWSAWDRGGGYYSTQMIVALSLLPLGLLAILLLAEEQPGNAGGVIDRFLVRMKPPVLVSLAIAIWALASLQTNASHARLSLCSLFLSLPPALTQ